MEGVGSSFSHGHSQPLNTFNLYMYVQERRETAPCGSFTREMEGEIMGMFRWNQCRKFMESLRGRATKKILCNFAFSIRFMIYCNEWSNKTLLVGLRSCLLTLFPPSSPRARPARARHIVCGFVRLRGNVFGLEINSAVGNRRERERERGEEGKDRRRLTQTHAETAGCTSLKLYFR